MLTINTFSAKHFFTILEGIAGQIKAIEQTMFCSMRINNLANALGGLILHLNNRS